MMRVRSLSAGISPALVLAPSVAGATHSAARRARTPLGTKCASSRLLNAALHHPDNV